MVFYRDVESLKLMDVQIVIFSLEFVLKILAEIFCEDGRDLSLRPR
jgi:hypothetical protein